MPALCSALLRRPFSTSLIGWLLSFSTWAAEAASSAAAPLDATGANGAAPAFMTPALILMVLHLGPAIHLLRRKAKGAMALYLFSQPVIWGLAGSIGLVVDVFSPGESSGNPFTPGVLSGLGILGISPFLYWRLLLRWLQLEDNDAA